MSPRKLPVSSLDSAEKWFNIMASAVVVISAVAVAWQRQPALFIIAVAVALISAAIALRRKGQLSAPSIALIAAAVGLLFFINLASFVQRRSAIPVAKVSMSVIESFGGSRTRNPHWVINGSAKLTDEGEGWLRLTSDTLTSATGAVGMALLNDPFSARSEISMEFDYATWGGARLSDERTGNGFSVFLIDGSKTPLGPGSGGGSLGYSCGGLHGPWICTGGFPGVPGGYVGIGFDEFGHFSERSTFGDAAAPGFSPDHVAIRGSGDGTTGYHYLTGRPAPGGIVTGSRAGARRVRITIVDQRVTVQIKDRAEFQTVIDKFNVAGAPGQVPLPPTLKIGFSGSTGAATNFHEIKGLRIKVTRSR